MDDQNNEAGKKLQKLGQRLRMGWKRLHPATKTDLRSIKASLKKEWLLRELIKRNEEERIKASSFAPKLGPASGPKIKTTPGQGSVSKRPVADRPSGSRGRVKASSKGRSIVRRSAPKHEGA